MILFLQLIIGMTIEVKLITNYSTNKIKLVVGIHFFRILVVAPVFYMLA